MAAVIQGRKADAEKLLTLAIEGGARGCAASRLADVATSAGLPGLAEQLLALVPASTRGRAGTLARLCWYRGDMSEAVRVLTYASASRAERRLRTRLASELSVFDGWVPELPAIPGYVPQPQTVLHLLTNSLPYTGSGYAQRSHSLLKAQTDLGWVVHAATRIGYPVQVGRLDAGKTDLIDGVTYHRHLPATLPRGLAARLQLQAEELLKLALKVQPAVLHTTTHFVNGLAVRAVAESLGIPWVYEVRGQLADTWASSRDDDAKQSERYNKFSAREAEVMKSAGAVATLGEAMQKRIIKAGVPLQDTVLLPNAVGGEFMNEPAAPAEARRRLGLPINGTFVGTVSSLVDYEGLDDLLRAFSLLAPQHPDLRCLIVGDGAAGPPLKRLAVELGLEKRVLFPGRIPREQAHLYHQALDVFVVPRKDFPVTRMVTPLKPVEALASGRPVVFSDLPALHEVVRDGTDGFSVPAGQTDALARVLANLVVDAQLAMKMGMAGRRRVLDTRTWGTLSESTARLYKKIEAKL
ncbi:glycosyltransferase family 4 protein [Arthrobacter sp. Helios]|uniref:glycosyltransferase family 4 protein n=1 Tax=Arthrobacter sp. Helios TaxID=2828862 RepID=UPI00206DBD44|nr:glycosyltransferase family 4 protein [Arthrobacter sp. Helios]UPO78658.1 glycosyltransferase family 4 protein [Arthrobacter sp. Helios]